MECLFNSSKLNKMSNTIKEFNIKAKKSFWQNFLQNTQVLEKIAREFDIRWKNILEIWPWYWALTSYLLDEKPTSLTLVELDLDMIEILNKRIENKELIIWNTNFEIVNIDVLKYEPNFLNYFVTLYYIMFFEICKVKFLFFMEDIAFFSIIYYNRLKILIWRSFSWTYAGSL